MSVVVGIKEVVTLGILDGKETEDVIGREVKSVEMFLTGRALKLDIKISWLVLNLNPALANWFGDLIDYGT